MQLIAITEWFCRNLKQLIIKITVMRKITFGMSDVAARELAKIAFDKEIQKAKGELDEELVHIIKKYIPEPVLKVMDEYSVDRSRVYMTGLSAGGFATYTLAIEHPEVFAAIAPDAAGADPAKVEALRGMPMWIFQAADDPTVKIVEYYNPTVEALKAAGLYYKSTLYAPGTVFGTSAHFSWVPMYANQEFRDWMFAQHK